MNTFRLVRLLRTLSSEIYLVWHGDRRVGQIDLHFADSAIQANLFLDVMEAKAAPACTVAEGLQTLRVNLTVLKASDNPNWMPLMTQ